MKPAIVGLLIAFFLSTPRAHAIIEDAAGEYVPKKGSGSFEKAPGVSASSEDAAINQELVTEERRKEQAAKRKRSEISLRAEPGDGIIKLSWQLADKQLKTSKAPLRYAVTYGTGIGKLTSRIDLGADIGSYTLRKLQNYQPYYMRITATSDDPAVSLRSDEIRATPIPTEDLSSLLEQNFSKKNQTLLDKNMAPSFNRELRQFGYEFFRNSAVSLDNMDNLPVGNDYVIGPGDSLSISLWGSVNARYELTVDRTGEVLIPKVGTVKVWGLSYDQAKDAVQKVIARYFKNFDISVTLGKLRSIQVFIVGEVVAPGSYAVSSLASVVNAISAAGGPNKNGSLRTIKLTRRDKTSSLIDLYDILLKGDRSGDTRLQNGDTIFVPVIGPAVAVAGEVKRPAIYEIKERTTLADAIAMAGGITASSYTGRIQVERFSGNSRKISLDFEPREGRIETLNAEVQDRDMIKIYPVQAAVRQIVSLTGNVARPGEYQFRKGMRLRDIIPDFDALLPESYLDSVEITRLVAPDLHKEVLTINLRKALAGNHSDNVLLQEQDSVRVYARSEMQDRQMVTISGEVVNPGSFDFYPGMTIRDLLTAAGSTKRNALLKKAELSRIGISEDKATPSRLFVDLEKALNNDPANNLTLQPDDVLIVRSITDWTEATDKFVTIKGEVAYPGVYSIARGERISSVIARAGGYTDKAYLKGAKYTRVSVREMQQKRMDEVLAKTEKEIIQKQSALASVAASKEELEATKAALESLQKDVERMKQLKAEGRLVIRLSKLEQLKKSDYDIEMEGGDILEVPPLANVVHVMGQVYSPTSFVYLPEDSSVESYLNKAGGATRDADSSELYIIRADGSVSSRQQSSSFLGFGGFISSDMSPGDTLVVPQKLERTAWLRDLKDITTILSQVALTAGTVLLGLK